MERCLSMVAHARIPIAVWAIASGLGSWDAVAEVAAIANGGLRVALDAETGTLRELVDPATGYNQLAGGTSPFALWQLKVAAPNAPEDLKDVSAEAAGRPTIERTDGARPQLRLSWKDVPVGGQGGSLQVDVIVSLERGPHLSRWDLVVSKAADLRLAQVRFPRVQALRDREGEMLAVPRELGILTKQPRRLARGKNNRGARLSWQYPRPLALQCLAFYQEDGPGLFAGCDDAGGHRKDLSVWGDGSGQMHFEVTHEPEQQAAGAAEFRLPFAVLLGAFQGDWSTAAQIYRDLPHARAFIARGRLARGMTPEWVTETGLWLWNRGRSHQVLEPARAMRAHLGAPVSILWHWWHNCPYDAGFPEYLPPREGESAFKTALAAAQKEDVRAILYMNQRLWGTTTQSWRDEAAEAHAVRERDGQIKIEVFNTFTKAPCAPMCIGTKFWRDKYAGLAEQALCGLRADGVYMDQTGVLASCYAADHGHIRGPGRYWTDGLAMLTSEIRDRTSGRGPVALGGEFCGEPWIGDLDLTLALSVSHDRIGAGPDWEPIPFFQAVYHPATIVFGNMAGLAQPPYDEKWPSELALPGGLSLLDRKFSRQFYLEQARTFAWGMQPMVANFLPSHLIECPREMSFVTRLVKTRMAALQYLRHGEWVRAPRLDVPEEEIDVAKVGTYTPLKAGKRRYAVALAGAWRAPGGDIGIALASIADERLVLDVPVDRKGYGLRGACSIHRIDETGRHPLGELDDRASAIKVELPQFGVCVIELCQARVSAQSGAAGIASPALPK